jgi:hypothetical protein
VLGNILRHPTNNALRSVVVEVCRSLTRLESTGSDLVVPESAGAGTGVFDAEGLAFGVLGAVAGLAAFFGVFAGEHNEGVVGCVGGDDAVEALEDTGLGRGIAADWAGGAEAGESGEGEELHDDPDMITLLWRLCLLCLKLRDAGIIWDCRNGMEQSFPDLVNSKKVLYTHGTYGKDSRPRHDSSSKPHS